MSIKLNLFGSFDNFRRSFQGNGAQSGKGGARKSGGKKRSAPKPFSPRLENLEERQLLSVVPPFADSIPVTFSNTNIRGWYRFRNRA